MSTTDQDLMSLGELVAADDARPEPDAFTLTYTGSGPVFAGRSWPDDKPVPSYLQIDELADLGWVRITGHQGDKGRIFTVTNAGRKAWREYVAQRDRPVGPRVELDWPAARQLLGDIYESYLNLGAPEMGVDLLQMLQDPEAGNQVDALVRELVRGEYLDVAFDSAAGPRAVRPSRKTIQMLAGWPASLAQESLNELVAAIDTEVDRTSDPDKKSTLKAVRDGLTGAAQQIAIAYIEKKIGAA